MIFTKKDKLSKSVVDFEIEGDTPRHFIFVDLTDYFNRNGIEVNDNYDVEDYINSQNLTPIGVKLNSENGTFGAECYDSAEPLKELVRRINIHLDIINPKPKVVFPKVGFKKTTKFGGGCLMTEFKASYNDVKAIFGKPNCEGSGDNKTTHEWQLIDDSGSIFNIYDWKEYRDIPLDEVISYHIGGSDRSGAMRLKEVFTS